MCGCTPPTMKIESAGVFRMFCAGIFTRLANWAKVATYISSFGGGRRDARHAVARPIRFRQVCSAVLCVGEMLDLAVLVLVFVVL